MHLIISIDDTDNLESRGTGSIATEMSDLLASKYYAECQLISRHQLFIHEDIAYTSHNSAMCFEVEINITESDIELVIEDLADYLASNSAEGSDPGLCVVQTKKLINRHDFLAFGYRAKKVVVTKEDAYQLAEHCSVHLSEHGGEGIGVIGAIAGAALRFGGNDGRYKGHIDVGINQDNMLVADLLKHPKIDKVSTLDGYILGENEEVFIVERIKTVRRNGEAFLLVEKVNINEFSVWRNCSKKILKELEGDIDGII